MNNEICEPHISLSSRSNTMIQVRYRKLFIGGIDSSLTEDEIKEYFQKFGDVIACTIHRDRVTNRSRGFGFITFDDPSAVDAVQGSRPHIIKGCEVTLKRAVPKELFQEFDGLLTVNRIFVGGLRQEVTELDLRDYFATFGRVRKVDVMVDRNTNAKRGFAFVEFEDYDPVDKVVLHGKHRFQGQEVTVRKAKSRLEMELLKNRINRAIPQDRFPSLLRCSHSFPVQDNRVFGPTLGNAYPRFSLDNLDMACPFHSGNRRRRFF